MIEIEKRLLTGRRILIPPARPDANPLLHILKRHGAETIEFPSLKPVPPSDFGFMDQAIEQINDYDWIVFSGSNSVVNFLKRFEALSCDISSLDGPRIAAIGHGAVSALKKEGVGVQYVPRVHTAEGVTADLGEVSGSLFLLVRVEGASRNLPQKLRDLGARVIEVAGYRMLVDATEETAGIAFGQRLDALALANPSAVRFLLKRRYVWKTSLVPLSPQKFSIGISKLNEFLVCSTLIRMKFLGHPAIQSDDATPAH